MKKTNKEVKKENVSDAEKQFNRFYKKLFKKYSYLRKHLLKDINVLPK